MSSHEDEAALRHARLSELVVAALERPASEREAFVRESCAGDAALADQALRLLARHGQADLAVGIAQPAIARAGAPSHAPAVEIAGYRVVRILGEGGMGTVYEAEQDRPRRRVALKLMRGWSAGREELARFEREAEVLGRLQHEGICQVHEVGHAAAGMPFIAMELVDGVPLIRHAAQSRLDRAQRLALACRICDAVAHAHERGVVHRDLKPDNILVTREGRPKILDFGIASASGMTVAASLMTRAGDVLGTLAYMSPEQAAGRGDVDHRADIFALGVILFELLTGERPANLEGLTLAQALHVIQQADHPSVTRGHASLRGDLGTILAKALERDPGRRYPTAAALAADIRRHLSHEPIVARPPSLAYRATKFTQRHRTMVVAASLVFAALTTGAALALRQAARANEQRMVATERAEAAERESYRAHLAAASSAVERGEWAVAAEHLSRAPAAQRGWEADALEAVVHEQFGRLLLDEPTRGMAFSANGAEAFTTRRRGEHGELVRLSLPEGRVIATYPLDARPLVVPREARALAIACVLETARPTAPFDIVEAEGGAAVALRPCSVVPAPLDAFVEALTPDGMLAALRTADGDTVVCDLRKGTVGDHRLRVSVDTALFPDGHRAIVALNTEAVVTDLLTGEVRWTTPPGHDASSSVAVSPDGHSVYTCGLNIEPFLRKWDPDTGRLLAEREVERGGGRAWAFAPDAGIIAWLSDAAAILILDADDFSERARRALPARTSTDLGLAPDGRQLLAATDRAGLRSWDLEAPTAHDHVAVHSSYVYDVAFSPDGERIASASWDDTVKIWETDTRDVGMAVTCTFATNATAVAWRRDGRAAIVHAGSALHLVDAASGSILVSRDGLPEHGGDLDASPADDVVVLPSPSGTRVLDASSLAILNELEPSLAAAFSPDGSRLAEISANGQVRTRDARTLQLAWSVGEATPPGVLQGLAWTPDGKRLAVLVGSRVDVRDALDGRLLTAIPDPRSPYAVTWSPDGRRLLIGQLDGALGVWDPTTGEQVVALEAHGAYIKALTFSPDGKVLATAGGDGDVQVWDTR